MTINLDIPKEVFVQAVKEEVARRVSEEVKMLEEAKSMLTLMTYEEAAKILGVGYSHFQQNIAGKEYSYKEGSRTKKEIFPIVNLGDKCKRVRFSDLNSYVKRLTITRHRDNF